MRRVHGRIIRAPRPTPLCAALVAAGCALVGGALIALAGWLIC